MGFSFGLATTLSITIVVDMTTAGARGTANSLRIMGNRLGQLLGGSSASPPGFIAAALLGGRATSGLPPCGRPWHGGCAIAAMILSRYVSWEVNL